MSRQRGQHITNMILVSTDFTCMIDAFLNTSIKSSHSEYILAVRLLPSPIANKLISPNATPTFKVQNTCAGVAPHTCTFPELR